MFVELNSSWLWGIESNSSSFFGIWVSALDVPKPFASGSWVLMEAEPLSQGPHMVRLDIPQPGHGHFSNTTSPGIEMHSQNKSVSHESETGWVPIKSAQTETVALSLQALCSH